MFAGFSRRLSVSAAELLELGGAGNDWSSLRKYIRGSGCCTPVILTPMQTQRAWLTADVGKSNVYVSLFGSTTGTRPIKTAACRRQPHIHGCQLVHRWSYIMLVFRDKDCLVSQQSVEHRGYRLLLAIKTHTWNPASAHAAAAA